MKDIINGKVGSFYINDKPISIEDIESIALSNKGTTEEFNPNMTLTATITDEESVNAIKEVFKSDHLPPLDESIDRYYESLIEIGIKPPFTPSFGVDVPKEVREFVSEYMERKNKEYAERNNGK